MAIDCHVLSCFLCLVMLLFFFNKCHISSCKSNLDFPTFKHQDHYINHSSFRYSNHEDEMCAVSTAEASVTPEKVKQSSLKRPRIE
ncbi:hypothetical protein M5689_000555 [Euphorbia peplus]|nr:hypothetical protein M5689_000555 [Euphorbia peplus]